jgi:hypothetical protein
VSGTSKATSARVVKRVDGSAALSSLLPTLVAPTSKLYSLCPSSAPASSSLLAAHRQSQADFSASLQAGSLERTSLVHCPESLLTRDGSAARLARVAQAAGEAMDVSAVPIAGNKGGSSSLQSNAFGAKKKATSAAAFFGGGGGVKKKEEKENKDKPAKASVFKSAKVPQKVSERVERAGKEGKGRAGERSAREERASEAGGKSGRAKRAGRAGEHTNNLLLSREQGGRKEPANNNSLLLRSRALVSLANDLLLGASLPPPRLTHILHSLRW